MMEDAGRPIRIAHLAAALESWAPPASAQSYDNVGLQIGRSDRTVRRALIALDLTPGVVAEAERESVDLVITHHPLIFRPLQSLTPSSLQGELALRMAELGIALYAAHTNLDAAHGGVSFALAETLGLQDVRFLERMPDTRFKLVTFVPADHVEAVRAALADAGAGQIGEYDACAFVSSGTGYFRAGDAAKPFIGTAGGDVEEADERRLEVELARWDLARVLGALRNAHPYEEVAYDVYPVVQEATRLGMGAIGNLAAAEPLGDFLARTAIALSADGLRYVGDLEATVSRVAVCGGAGSDLIGAARRAGADVLVTADVTYHRFFESMKQDGSIGMAIIDAGHYETEAMTEELLRQWLQTRFPDVVFLRAKTRTSPVHWYHSRPGS